MRTGKGYYADDPEQSRLCRGATSSRTNHMVETELFSKLGTITMKYLSEMTDERTLTMYSGHPMGLFPSQKEAPRVVVTNGMVIPNYSKPDDWEKMNALGVSQYGK
jgi:hypothetical protein